MTTSSSCEERAEVSCEQGKREEGQRNTKRSTAPTKTMGEKEDGNPCKRDSHSAEEPSRGEMLRRDACKLR